MKIRAHKPGRLLWWLIIGSITFFVLFVTDVILTSQNLQFWIGDYHVHHSLIGLVLVITSSATLAYKWKRRKILPRAAIIVLLIGILLMIEWGILHYTECGGRYLFITKNE